MCRMTRAKLMALNIFFLHYYTQVRDLEVGTIMELLEEIIVFTWSNEPSLSCSPKPSFDVI